MCSMVVLGSGPVAGTLFLLWHLFTVTDCCAMIQLYLLGWRQAAALTADKHLLIFSVAKEDRSLFHYFQKASAGPQIFCFVVC